MLLTADIGNTNITFGLFKGKRLTKKINIPTKDYCLQILKGKLGRMKPSASIICSVVPDATKILKRDLRRLLGKESVIIGKDIKVPIKNLYRKPEQVGQDRLVNAYAGVKLYGAPLIVVDFGTAVTFDCISRRGEYLGGMILPGLRISLEALAQKTALLPKIGLELPRELIGRDSKNSMLSGIVFGFAALTDDLVKRIKNKIGKNAKVIGTGGNIQLVGKYCHDIDICDISVTLKGLNLIWKELHA